MKKIKIRINSMFIVFTILALGLILIHGCVSQKPEDVIKNMDKNAENCVFIITEYGCIPCNMEMSRLASKFVDMQGIYVVVNANANGTVIDISPYWEAKKTEQISYDTNRYFDKHDLKSSYAIFIKNDRIDTILDADARRLINNKKYILKRITSQTDNYKAE